jgi:hypothetical protein
MMMEQLRMPDPLQEIGNVTHQPRGSPCWSSGKQKQGLKKRKTLKEEIE